MKHTITNQQGSPIYTVDLQFQIMPDKAGIVDSVLKELNDELMLQLIVNLGWDNGISTLDDVLTDSERNYG